MLETIKEKKRVLISNFSKRKGWFRVSAELLENATLELLEFMSHFLIIRAEFIFAAGCIEYHALSELFDPVEDGYDIPEYDFIVEKDETGAINIKPKRISVTNGDSKGTKLLRLLRKIDV